MELNLQTMFIKIEVKKNQDHCCDCLLFMKMSLTDNFDYSKLRVNGDKWSMSFEIRLEPIHDGVRVFDGIAT